MSDSKEIQVFREPDALVKQSEKSAISSWRAAADPEVPDLASYWQVLWYRRRTILAVFLLIFNGVLAGTLLMTPVYRATGLLEIRRENVETVPLETLFRVETVADDYLETQFGILNSTTLAERVIRENKLYSLSEFNPDLEPPWWTFGYGKVPPPPPKGQEVTPKVVAQFQKKLLLNPQKGSRLVQVNFNSKDPELAANVVNSILRNYINLRTDMAHKTGDWLSVQLKETQAKLEKAEGKLREYAKQTGLVFIESVSGNPENLANDRLKQTQQELTVAQANRYEKQSLYNLVTRGDTKALQAVGDDPVIQGLQTRLADLRRELAMLQENFTDAYPKVRETQSQIQELEASLDRERQRAAQRIRNDYTAAVQRENYLHQELGAQKHSFNDISDKASTYNILKRDVDTYSQLYAGLQQKLKEIGVSEGLKATNVGIVDLAVPPDIPDSPVLLLNLALACVAGLTLGVGAAFLHEHLDTSFKTLEDVDRRLDATLLGTIPSVAGHLGSHNPADAWVRIDRSGQTSAMLAEAFGTLRTSILLSRPDQPPATILITSSVPGEGKTTVSVNLALSMTQLQRKVLLLDADFRRPSLHRALGLENRTGLADFLSNGHDWRRAIQRVAGLHVLTSGPVMGVASGLLSSPRLRTLLEEAKKEFDTIILDGPGMIIQAPDARILAHATEATVVVVRSGDTPREVVQRALSLAPNLIGVVLNDFNLAMLPRSYRQYYGEENYPPDGGWKGRPSSNALPGDLQIIHHTTKG